MIKNDFIESEIVSCKDIYDTAVSISRLCSEDRIEVILVSSGSGIHQVINQVIPCNEGDIYVVPPHIPHGFFSTDARSTLELRRIRFDCKSLLNGEFAFPDGERACYGIFRDSSVAAYAMLNSSTKQTVESLFELITDELEHKHNEWKEAIRSYVSILLITIGRYVNSAIKSLPVLPQKELSLASRTVKEVSERFSEGELTLESIASSLYVSKSHLSRVFKSVSGESFSDYLRKVRLSNATNLLITTQLNVEEIAVRCGFRDIPSFYKNFQNYTGFTPNQYRLKSSNGSREHDRYAELCEVISLNLQRGSVSGVKETVESALKEGYQVKDILGALLKGMSRVGEKFKNNEIYVPEVLVAARAMNTAMQILKPLLVSEGIPSLGRVCIGTVQGDLHDIGKNLVKMMLEGKGFEVIDLGTDVSADEFVNAAIENNCSIILCSALLTTTMGVMREVVEKADEKGIRPRVKIMIGGAPVSRAYCEQIGADAYSDDAAAAADIAVELIRI